MVEFPTTVIYVYTNFFFSFSFILFIYFKLYILTVQVSQKLKEIKYFIKPVSRISNEGECKRE